MKFPEALSMVFLGCRATRTSWDDPQKSVTFDAKAQRIRYQAGESDFKRDNWNYYPTQADMLADDWELAR